MCPTSSVPPHVTNHVQYGSRPTALAVYLHHIQLIPYKRVSDMIEVLYQHSISTVTLANMVKRAKQEKTCGIRCVVC